MHIFTHKVSWFLVSIASLVTLLTTSSEGKSAVRLVELDNPPEERSILLISSRYDGELLQLTNQQRSSNGVPALRLSAQLGRAAQNHAEDMANQNFFSHTGSNGSRMSDRVNQVGYSWQAVAENIYMGTNASPNGAINGWMNSTGHRRNMLNSNYIEIGFGVATRGRNVYYVQVFGRPR